MALRSGASRTRATAPHDTLHVPLDRTAEWAEPDPPARDWKKIVLIAGLAALSWVATYVGMLELIQSNMGSLPLIHKVIIGFSVGMLMTMIVWLLDQMFSPLDWFTRLSYVAGYIFLTIISIGFSFGFYWKVLESRVEAARSATSAVGQVQSSLHGASTRLEQLQATLQQLSAVSTEKAAVEREKGTSCPNSSPGDGPRRKMRDEDAARFTFASEFVKGRVGAIKGDMAALDAELAKIVADDPSIIDAKSGTRNEFMRALGRRLDMTVTGFNAFRTDPQLRQIRTDLADRAERTTIPDSHGGTIACPDVQLQGALRGVVRAIDQLPSLEKPEIAAVEGSEATIEAFRRLTTTFFGLLSFKLPPSADELRELQQKAVQSIENPAALHALNEEAVGLSKRDYIPLGTAVFVDLCLLLVSIGRPMNRFVATRQRMIEAERGPVFPILSRFNEIHNHEEMRRTFDVFREVIFESGGTYYVAVPLNAPRGHPEREQLRRDAQTLANLCYALEGQGVLTRPWKLAPTLVARRKLSRQGSKFIECYRDRHVAPVPRALRALKGLFISDRGQNEQPAFRIYAFKSGAWPEMILGAVMGAAGRIEAERRRQQQPAAPAEETLPAPARETAARAVGPELPDLDARASDTGLRGIFKHRPGGHDPASGTVHNGRRPAVNGSGGEGPRSAAAAAPQAHATPDFRQRFGSYANHAQAELATYRELEEEEQLEDPLGKQGAQNSVVAEPANSNTAPADGGAKMSPEPADIVVPFPAPRAIAGARASQALAERLAAALAAADQSAGPLEAQSAIGVELRRETAMFHVAAGVPVNQGSRPDASVGLAGGEGSRDQHAAEPPQLELTFAAPEAAGGEANARPAHALIEDKSDGGDHGEFDPPLVLRRMVD
jgi:hypothetical protein